MNVHVVADSDTRWKWGAALARRFSDGPSQVHGHLLEGRAVPNDQQLIDADGHIDVAALHRVGIGQVLADLGTADVDVIVLACVGGTIQALLHGLAHAWQGRVARPVVVTGYVGVVYERMVDGLLLRAGADLVIANSSDDAQHFRAVFEAVGADPDTIVQSALPFLGGAAHDPTAAGRTRPFTVTFAAQPSVPAGRDERRYALRQTLEHARRWPERQVILKLRGRLGEQTTHVEHYHYADLLPAQGIPSNVEIAYGAMSDVLDRTDLLVTLSSTAALEAIDRGIPAAVLVDFGVLEELGNHFFLGSGALTSWHALHDGVLPKMDPSWAARNGVGAPDPFGMLSERVAALSAERAALPPLRPWLRPEEAASYLPNLLRRRGLDSDGSPLAGGVPKMAGAGAARRLMLASARRLYRVGVDRVEPAIRRWAQL